MSVDKIRAQLSDVLVKLGLVPKPEKPNIIINTKDKEFIIPCSEKD